METVTCFGIVFCTVTFQNGIMYPFPTDSYSWSWISFSQFLLKWANLFANRRFGIFPANYFLLLKGEHLLPTVLESILKIFWTKQQSFWSKSLLTWDTIASFVVLFYHISMYFYIHCSLSYGSKIALHHVACCCSVKGFFSRRKIVAISDRKKTPTFYIWSFLSQRHMTWTFW